SRAHGRGDGRARLGGSLAPASSPARPRSKILPGRHPPREGHATGRRASQGMSLPPLCLISDAQRVGEERFLWALREAINAGLRMVQVREPSWSVDQVRDLALKVRKIGEEEAMGSLVLITNRRSELVLELDLAGVHV